MKSFKILFLLLTITYISCKNNTTKKADNLKFEKVNKSEKNNKIENKKKLENVALSFHKWYVKNNNYYPDNNSKKERTSFTVIEGDNNKCKVDYNDYFKNLRKLGTVSEKFLQKEKERTRKCAEFLMTINWSDYSTAEGYEYEEFCDYLYYMYWTRSQENTEKIEVSEINKNSDFWNAIILIDGRKVNVKIEEESEKYMITQIDWVD